MMYLGKAVITQLYLTTGELVQGRNALILMNVGDPVTKPLLWNMMKFR